MMNFQEKLANYVLGNLTRSYFPDIALTALNEGIESESLLILAGMTDRDNTFELQKYFEGSLIELAITLPNKTEAAHLLLRYYLGEMISHPDKAFEAMYKIDNDIYHQVDWQQELGVKDKKFVGDELGLERLYTWYRELQDFEDNGMLLYFNELPRDKQKEKFQERLVEEAKVLKSEFDRKISAYNKA
jgi:hypothetical protein